MRIACEIWRNECTCKLSLRLPVSIFCDCLSKLPKMCFLWPLNNGKSIGLIERNLEDWWSYSLISHSICFVTFTLPGPVLLFLLDKWFISLPRSSGMYTIKYVWHSLPLFIKCFVRHLLVRCTTPLSTLLIDSFSKVLTGCSTRTSSS